MIDQINQSIVLISISTCSPPYFFTFPFFELVLKANHILSSFIRVFTIKLIQILLVLLDAITLLASASSIVDFVPSSLAMGMRNGSSNSRKKPLGHSILKGPYGHQVSLIYSVSVLIKLGLKYCSGSFFHIYI